MAEDLLDDDIMLALEVSLEIKDDWELNDPSQPVKTYHHLILKQYSGQLLRAMSQELGHQESKRKSS